MESRKKATTAKPAPKTRASRKKPKGIDGLIKELKKLEKEPIEVSL